MVVALEVGGAAVLRVGRLGSREERVLGNIGKRDRVPTATALVRVLCPAARTGVGVRRRQEGQPCANAFATPGSSSATVSVAEPPRVARGVGRDGEEEDPEPSVRCAHVGSA